MNVDLYVYTYRYSYLKINVKLNVFIHNAITSKKLYKRLMKFSWRHIISFGIAFPIDSNISDDAYTHAHLLKVHYLQEQTQILACILRRHHLHLKENTKEWMTLSINMSTNVRIIFTLLILTHRSLWAFPNIYTL